MFRHKRLLCSSVLVFMVAGTASAQENRAPVDKPREPVESGPLVTATANAKRVRFVSPGSIVQLRLEVYNETGRKLFDTELRGGNVLDWQLQDGAGERLATGSYACVLTIKSLSGRMSQRVGSVTVTDKKVAIETAGAAQLSLAQQQTIGPVEGYAAFTVLQESEAEAITTVTHDGNDGQMSRTRGALSFRVGDFFAGKDKEQMRLTAEGNLGLGTSKPEAKLDVAGLIRAREGLMFSDGSTLNVNEKGVLTRTAADGADPKSVTATTQNKIAKFTDNIGTVGDSVITESVGGFIGVGAPTPQSLLQVGPNTGYGTTTGLLITNNLIGSQFDRAFQLAPRQTANPATNSILMYALPTVNTGVTVPSQFGLFIDEKQGTGAITSYAGIATGRNPSLGATNNTHLLMGTAVIPNGNFGIYDNSGHKSFFKGSVGLGTTSPLRTLQIGPNINAAFTLEASDITPNAGYIRFGDQTGWKLHIGRNREVSVGALNSGTNGVLMTIQDNGNVGIGTTTPNAKLDVKGLTQTEGMVVTNGLSVYLINQPSQSDPLCISNANFRVGFCSSSLRYKRDLTRFDGGLNIINRLRPINFTWKEDGKHDIGLAAEEVAAIDPLLTFRNHKGEIEGVRYDQLSPVFINAFKEQQAQIQQQQAQISALQRNFATLSARLRGMTKTLKNKSARASRRR